MVLDRQPFGAQPECQAAVRGDCLARGIAESMSVGELVAAMFMASAFLATWRYYPAIGSGSSSASLSSWPKP